MLGFVGDLASEGSPTRFGQDSSGAVAALGLAVLALAGLGRTPPHPPSANRGSTSRCAATTAPSARACSSPSCGPLPRTGSITSTEQIAEWLTNWATAGREPIRSFDVPIGPARLIANRGTEVTTYEVVVRASAGVVVTVSGAGSYPADELEKVARGISG